MSIVGYWSDIDTPVVILWVVWPFKIIITYLFLLFIYAKQCLSFWLWCKPDLCLPVCMWCKTNLCRSIETIEKKVNINDSYESFMFTFFPLVEPRLSSSLLTWEQTGNMSVFFVSGENQSIVSSILTFSENQKYLFLSPNSYWFLSTSFISDIRFSNNTFMTLY